MNLRAAFLGSVLFLLSIVVLLFVYNAIFNNIKEDRAHEATPVPIETATSSDEIVPDTYRADSVEVDDETI